MTAELYRVNRPAAFWRLVAEPQPTEAEWTTSIQAAASALPPGAQGADIDAILKKTLGEGQFGPDHWDLSFARKMYYRLKPVLPRPLTRRLRRLQRTAAKGDSPLGWPVEARYAQFLWAVIGGLLAGTKRQAVPFIHFWPAGHKFAFVLTHDVETAEGQEHVRALADLEADYGFRSSFNFVPERYRLDQELINTLRSREFEVGVHGLKHDGKLFSSRAEFMRRAARINQYLKDLDAVGFRAPFTHRQPEWMQALDVEYDLSFFDTDPYEPVPGGTMSIWPFEIGRFVELPYTLVQDYTLTAVLGETTPRIWLEKVDFIETYWGLALVNSHPDYLRDPANWRLYEQFLQTMRRRAGPYWHALPREVARWWRARRQAARLELLPGAVVGTITLDPGHGDAGISISQPADRATQQPVQG
jgi:peptidoglycan/xylan/chitin deacetylase (PgdA/CDA1 family)